MAQSTPLNQLPKPTQPNQLNMEDNNMQPQPQLPTESNNSNQTDNDLVNEILNEMDPYEGPQNDINADLLNHLTDQSQIPPEKTNPNFLINSEASQDLGDLNEKLGTNTETSSKKKSKFGFNLNFGGLNCGSKGSKSMLQKCIDNLKATAVLFVLVLITNLPQVNRLVLTRLPTFLNENGAINMKGILFKTSLVAVLFCIISFFL